MIVSFVSSKGGAGKTTGAALLASYLCSIEKRVTLIDGDANHPFSSWLETPVESISVIRNDNAETLIDDTLAADERSDVVIVDLEGSANIKSHHAISVADLVLVPLMPSQLDADEVGRTLHFINNAEKALRRPINHHVYFNRLSGAIRTRHQALLEEQAKSNGFPMLQTGLIEKEAYRAMFSLGKPLFSIKDNEVSGLKSAKENAVAFSQQAMNLGENRDG